MAKAIRTRTTSRPATANQVQNNDGGFTFAASSLSRLERFLVLGIDGGTYYVDEKDLAKSNLQHVRNLIAADESMVLGTTVDISDAGRAYRNDPALLTMALLLHEGKDKQATVAATPKVARIGTHAFMLAKFIDQMGGWGPAKMAAIRAYLASKTPDQLAYDAVKYRQREGWTHRDLMRKAHPKGLDHDVAEFILRGTVTSTVDILVGFDKMQRATNLTQVLSALHQYPNLPWETIPTQFLKNVEVWRVLFDNGQLKGQALLRNVTRLAKLGAFNDQIFAHEFADKLTDERMIAKTRLHPMQYLNAYVVYTQGGQARVEWNTVYRNREWTVHPVIEEALDDGFGLAFGNIEPSGKRYRVAIDTSASMGWYLAGSTQLTAYQAAGAMALITARVEPEVEVVGFSHELFDLPITAADSLNSATAKLERAYGGGTNIALAFSDALDRRRDIDTFVVITDNEVNAGRQHPHLALRDYRQRMGIGARLAVMAVTPTPFTVADPEDRGMLDVVGFDTNTPSVISDFSAGRI